ncbi:MAG: carboxymuconolactone decarboxylase family protein [Acidimicrobiales bacterium]
MGTTALRASAVSERVPLKQVPPDIAERLRSRGAGQLNLYRALANSSSIVRAWFDFLWTLRDGCTTERGLRELVILRTAFRHRSEYEWHHHAGMAIAAGVSLDCIDAAATPRLAAGLSGSEILALELTDAICDGDVPEQLARRATDHFGYEAYVELVVTASAYVMVPRVLDALGVPLEEATSPRWPPEPGEPKTAAAGAGDEPI